MTRILLFGAGGQLGQEIVCRAAAFGIEIAARSHQDTDIADPATVRQALAVAGADIAVNAAAYTKVDEAEDEPEEAFRVNATGAGVLARTCAAAAVPIVHVSTDYVFDGMKHSPYREDDGVAPLNVYGASKAAGEDAVRAGSPRHVILRTSWLFGRYGSNFLKTVLRLASERDRLAVVADQHGCPTASADVAEAIFKLAQRLTGGDAPWGTYHFAGSGVTTWHGFAQEVVDQQAHATGRRPQVIPIATAAYPTRARRPTNSRLACDKFAATFQFDAKSWQLRVREAVGDLIVEGSA